MILVTGGTGFLGRAVVDALGAGGHAVRVLARRPVEGAAFGPTAEVVLGDLRDAPSLDRAVAGAEAVVHAAAVLTLDAGGEAALRAVNVEGTRALAHAARRAGVRRFVHVSTAGVYGDDDRTPAREDSPARATRPYERSKRDAERALLDALAGTDVEWTVLRPAGIYGPGRAATARFVREVGRRRVWLHGPTEVIVHPTYVDDVVAAVRLSLLRDDLAGETLNVAGARWLRYEELIALVAMELGRRVRQLRVPRAPARHLAQAVAGACRVARRPIPVRVQGSCRRHAGRAVDTSKARALLGVDPLPLETGIARTIAWAAGAGLL